MAGHVNYTSQKSPEYFFFFLKSTLATFLHLTKYSNRHGSYYSWARFIRMGKVKKNDFLKDF